MSRAYSIETGQPEKILQHISEEANKELHNPNIEELAALHAKYNGIMEEYEKAEGDEQLQDSILDRASAVISQISALSEKLEKQEIPSMSDLELQSKMMTHEQLIDDEIKRRAS